MFAKNIVGPERARLIISVVLLFIPKRERRRDFLTPPMVTTAQSIYLVGVRVIIQIL
jgi:hypothetical protein